jgi:hypothetical protein
MLDDAAILRWSRQILLPDVGGRGQERIGAARVAVVGAGPVAAVAADLLRRAGVGEVTAAGPADVVVDVGGAADAAGVRVAVTAGPTGGTVESRPAPGRPAPAAPRAGHPALAAPAAIATGALAAAEALLLVLGVRTDARRQTVDVGSGVLGGPGVGTPG